MFKIHYIILFFCISIVNLVAQTFPVKAIIQNGPNDKKINIVFLGDGYKITEMVKYENDVQKTVAHIFSESPYKEYESLFNVYAIEVPSNQSGTSHPGTASDCGVYKDSVISRDTYFKTTYDAGGIHRLLVANNYDAVNTVLENNFPEYDIVFMIVNFNWYGGSGGSIAVFSTDTQSSEIAIHESGHSFAHLADEYDYGAPGNVPSSDGINYTIHTERDSIPWEPWILPTTPIPTPNSYSNVIGLFEGAVFTSKGAYRPKLNCKMRALNFPFCEVCLEQHVKTMFSYLNLIESELPDSLNTTLFTNTKSNFIINILQTGLPDISTIWKLDNAVIAVDTASIELDGSALAVGKHNLSVTVAHSSPFVRNDPDKLLQSSFSWKINVTLPTGINPIDNTGGKYSLEQNYPNPFNPATTIKYSIPKATFVQLIVYDVLGKKVKTLLDSYKDAGTYKIEFDGSNLSSGIYFYKITIGSYTNVGKMILVR
ncbi:MAG: T9SS type A sorting domain-containing protein [Ignavibacteriaceae bacterium]